LSYEERAFARQLGLDVTTYASGKQELMRRKANGHYDNERR
jgi:hypothetical protein